MHEFIPKRIHQTHTGSWSTSLLRALSQDRVLFKRLVHINEKGQTALTLADGLGDICISLVYQRDTLTHQRSY